MDEGVNHQLIQLCELQLGSRQKPTVAQPRFSRQQKKRKLWNKSWNIMFRFLNGPHRKQDTHTKRRFSLSEVDQLHAHVYDLRMLRKFDEANSLEDTVQSLTEGGISDSLRRVLQLLIALAELEPKDPGLVVGHMPLKLPIVFPRHSAKGVLPEGPLCHGDTQTQRKDDPYYTHFPSELFELPGVSIEKLGVTKYQLLDPTVFHVKPGVMLRGNGVFNVMGNLEDRYEKRVEQSLFGALTFSRSCTLDIKLDIPDIRDTWNTRILELKPAQTHEFEDEGFVDRTPSRENLSCEAPLLEDVCAQEEADERNIWELALEYKPRHCYTWEHRGLPPVVSERPYLTEAGPEAFTHLYAIYRSRLQLLDPCLEPVALVTVSMATLVKNTVYMLIGVPSQIFHLHQETFSMATGVHVRGTSPEAVNSALQPLLVCGSQYVRLVSFSCPQHVAPNYHAGLVFQAFTVGVRKYLQHYRACVLSITMNKTLLQISALLEILREQMRILSRLCQCDDQAPSAGTLCGKDFPTGVRLLSYLYEMTFEAFSSRHYPMLLSLLHTSCRPYIMFVREWVFQGNCHDIYGEFLIQTNEDYLRFRDRHYWTRGYVPVSGNLADSVPVFLQDLANDIFVCGKSINLLRVIAPEHFLLALDGDTPNVSITFSEEEICVIEQQCRMYKSRMQEVARQHSKAIEDTLREQEQAKQDLLMKARKTAMERITKFHARSEAIKKAIDMKKRAAFAELKEYMEKDIKRRAGEKEQEHAEDVKRLAATNRQELLEAAIDEDMVKQARLELIEQYERMGEAVARREYRAQWRVARHRLETRRLNFLTEDEDKWQAELVSKPLGVELPNTASGSHTAELMSGKLSNAEKDDNSDAVETHPVILAADQVNLSEVAEPGSGAADTTVAAGQVAAGAPASTSGRGERGGEDRRKSLLNTANIFQTHSPTGSAKSPQDAEGPGVGRPGSGGQERGGPESSGQESGEMGSGRQKRVEESGGQESGSQEGGEQESGGLGSGKPENVGQESGWLESGGQESGQLESGQQESGQPESSGQESGRQESVKPNSGGPAQRTAAPGVEEAGARPCVRMSANMSATTESQHLVMRRKPGVEEAGARPCVRMSANMSATTQSQHLVMRRKSGVEEAGARPCVRMSANMSATTESQHLVMRRKSGVEEAGARPCVRMSANMSATTQSQQTRHLVMRRKPVGSHHVGEQSEPQPARPSRSRRAGPQSGAERPDPAGPLAGPAPTAASNYSFMRSAVSVSRTPALFNGSDFSNFLIKPRNLSRKCSDMTVCSGVGMNPDRYACKESQFIDFGKIKLEKFKALNVHGHSSDSSVQRLLYGENFGRRKISRAASLQEEHEDYDIEPWTEIELEEYNKDFTILSGMPAVDLMNKIGSDVAFLSWGDYEMNAASDVSGYSYISLAALMKRSVKAPLATQIQLVNQGLMNFFTADLDINMHFLALRRFLLLQDGEFGQSLSDQLFEKLAQNLLPHEMLNPMYLNNVLSRALRSSIHGDTRHAALVSFALKYIPTALNHHGPNALDCLELAYKVDWPVNVVITEGALTKYCRVFSFMLQLKRAVWVLKDVWHRLKRDAVISKADTSAQSRRLQLCRHEMQHFVKVMQGYIANQVIHVTWQELQQDLAKNAHSLDDLHRCHTEYLDKCVCRCLLSKEAAPVMKIIKEIFKLILKFRKQLISHNWQLDEGKGVVHPAYDSLCQAYKVFKDYARFLFKVVNKLAMRGYQPHLQELLLRLNFNSYYSE